MSNGRRLLLTLVAASVWLASACQADVSINLDIEDNGSGNVDAQVVFDTAAVEALGNLEEQLRVVDLERAGWTIDIEVLDDGSALLNAAKPVGQPNDWQRVLDELAGPGVFDGVEIVASDEFAKSTQRISYELDLSKGWELFSDGEVATALGGEPFGAPIDQLTDGRTIDEIVSVELRTGIVTAAEDTASVGTFAPRFDDQEPLRVSLTSTVENSTAVLLRWIAVALGSLAALATVLAVTGIVLQRRSDRLRPASTPASLASRVPGKSAPTAASGAAPVAAVAATQVEPVRLVVVEPRSVLYQQSKSIDTYLLPFVRHNGGMVRADTILEGYEGLVVGSMDTEGFWDLCGVEGGTDAIDETYLKMRRLRPGVSGFLDEMQRRRIPVAATTNDASRWSDMSRDRDRLSAVWPWLVSADVGVKKPDLGMFERMRRESGVAYAHCLYVDTDLESLDAAKELGMKTALFDTGDLDLPKIIGHPVVTDFKGLFAKS